MSVYAEKRYGRDTGWWVCEFRNHPKLGRVRERFQTRKEAVALDAHITAYGEFPEAFLKGRYGDPTHSWNAAHDDLKAAGGPDGRWRTKGQDKSQACQHAFIRTQPIGHTPVEKITYDVVQAFLNQMAARPGRRGAKMSPRTLNRYTAAISVVLTHAVRKGWIERLPVMPKQANPEHYQPLYTPTMLEGVCGALATMGEPDAAFLCRILYHSALRAGELLGLRPENVDEEYVLLLDPRRIKNKECRVVHIGAEAARQLRAIIAAGRMPKYRRLHHVVTRANEKCGYEMVRPLHAFRHTAASSIAGDDSLSLEDAQELLGHRNPATTQLYRDRSEAFLRTRAKNLSQRRGKVEGIAPAPVLISLAKKVS